MRFGQRISICVTVMALLALVPAESLAAAPSCPTLALGGTYKGASVPPIDLCIAVGDHSAPDPPAPIRTTHDVADCPSAIDTPGTLDGFNALTEGEGGLQVPAVVNVGSKTWQYTVVPIFDGIITLEVPTWISPPPTASEAAGLERWEQALLAHEENHWRLSFHTDFSDPAVLHTLIDHLIDMLLAATMSAPLDG
jgi:hypothetical protein